MTQSPGTQEPLLPSYVLSDSRLRTIVESSIQGILVHQDGIIQFVNSALVRMFGYDSPQELVGKPHWETLVSREEWPVLKARTEAFMRGERLPIYPGWKGIRKDGSTIWVQSSASTLEWNGRPALLAFMMDVTERKQTEERLQRVEEQLRQSQKMEAIGLLAGGVAHDFNNILTVINGYAETLLEGSREKTPEWEMLREIRHAGERAASLTRQLLAFSRKAIVAPVILDLNLAVSDLEKMLCRLIGEDIDLVVLRSPVLSRIKADPSQLEQIILNLVVNARDAMPQGGTLTLETREEVVDEEAASSMPDARPGRYVVLRVTDTGCGMDAATRARIFEPFFTTKETGKGTGLGLAMVYGAVTQSGGHIRLDTAPGMGTTFHIYLPAVPESADSKRQEADRYAPMRGNETILLAEDEAGVLSLVELVLRASGYQVLTARDGYNALEAANQFSGTIHLLVTDVVMPRMGGRQLADLLRTTRPSLKVIFLSGYTDDAVMRHGIADTGLPFLQKPFAPSALLAKIRDILDH